MYVQKTMKDLTLRELGNYAQNILVTGCPLIVTVDYTADPIKELTKLTEAECEEIIRYANTLAGEKYFDPQAVKERYLNSGDFAIRKDPSVLEEKLIAGAAA